MSLDDIPEPENGLSEYDIISARLDDMQRLIREAQQTSSDVKVILDAIMGKIDLLLAEVKPALDQVMESSVFRMITGGKKRSKE
ncbi:MAG TPA: hypothetical protein VJ553_05620 [Candidatus Paceibacterota bacterium]|nr:hypothetical protein [Candidatus Paceibacterota bacterium]